MINAQTRITMTEKVHKPLLFGAYLTEDGTDLIDNGFSKIEHNLEDALKIIELLITRKVAQGYKSTLTVLPVSFINKPLVKVLGANGFTVRENGGEAYLDFTAQVQHSPGFFV